MRFVERDTDRPEGQRRTDQELPRRIQKTEAPGNANERLGQELESWENGGSSSVKAYEPKNKCTSPGTVEESLASALKAANTRANGLQMSANSLRAENEVLQKQLQSPAYTYDPQIQEQVDRLRVQNEHLQNAAADAQTLKADLMAQFGVEVQQLEQQFANKTLELELGFNQGFENLRAIRDQWLTQKRRSEEEHYRAIVAADLQRKLEHQGQEDRLMAICKDDLRSRKIGPALKVSNFDAGDEKLVGACDWFALRLDSTAFSDCGVEAMSHGRATCYS